MFDRDPERPSYPDEWRVSLDRARGRVNFPILLPDQPGANHNNLTDVFVRDDDSAVFLIFPVLGEPEQPTRKHYVEIYIERWSGGNPRTEYVEFVAKAAGAGYEDRYSEIDGHPAIIVPAHSKADIEEANAAFLRMVVGGVELQISGGESLERLERIAHDLVAQYDRM